MKYLQRLGAGTLLLALTLPAQSLSQAEAPGKRGVREATEVPQQLAPRNPRT
jgi:hypothetical protein